MPSGALRKLSYQTNGGVSALKNRLSIHVLGLATVAFLSSNCAQAVDYKISAARAAATHKCNLWLRNI
jgi:hypothetical protein